MSAERKIVTVGGGNGAPIINEALLRTNEVQHVTTIGNVFDSGGATGRRRLDSFGREIAYGDVIRIYPSLIHPHDKDKPNFQIFKNLISHRDERDKSAGQDIFHRLFDEEGGFAKVKELMVDGFNLNVMGELFPASVTPADLGFETIKRRRFLGEHELDDNRMSKDMVNRMWLQNRDGKPVKAFEGAANALIEADIVFLAPGGLHGSVFPNFLPDGMTDALSESDAKMYVVTNVASTRNETGEFEPEDYVDTVEQYTGRRPSGLIVPNISRREFEAKHPDVTEDYADERIHMLGWESEQFENVMAEGVEIIVHNATVLRDVKVQKGERKRQVLRHDIQKLSEAIAPLVA